MSSQLRRHLVGGDAGRDALSGGTGLGNRCDGGPGTDQLTGAPGGCETTVGIP